MGKKRILLNDDQRCRLAVKGKVLGRKLLDEIGTLFTPDTILRWHRELVAQKWDHSDKRRPMGRPPTPQEVVDRILQLARENPSWGYDRIADALTNIGHQVCDRTVGNILKAHGIEPAPERKRTTTWSTFLKAHWNQLAAIDFTTIEVWTTHGLVTYYLQFAMRLATRQVCFLGCTPNPGSPWMAPMARNLTDAFDGFLRAPVRFVLMDRDTNFTAEFQAILTAAEVKPVLLPPKSPNCNAHLERFFRSLKDEALSRIILFGETALRETVNEYLIHYHRERAHQGRTIKSWSQGRRRTSKPEKSSAMNDWVACSSIIIGKRPDFEAAWLPPEPNGRGCFHNKASLTLSHSAESFTDTRAESSLTVCFRAGLNIFAIRR